MINLLVSLIVLALVFGVIWWIFTSIIPLPAPLGKIIQVAIALIFVLVLLGLVFGGFDVPVLHFR